MAHPLRPSTRPAIRGSKTADLRVSIRHYRSTGTKRRVKPSAPTSIIRGLVGPGNVSEAGDARRRIVSLMSSHRISVLDESVLDLPVKGLKSRSEVFLGKPLCLRCFLFPWSVSAGP